MSDVDDRIWLESALPKHQRLSVAVAALLENMLTKSNIEYLNVTSRVKTLDGAIEKIARKEYSDAESQLTDLSGIRVITYLEAQVTQVSKIIRNVFEVDETNSLDRATILGHDRIGYRSTHFVCSLGAKRDALPEYEELGHLKFEIQIRTVLQHAWAELAHDRSFKFGVALPAKIQRRLNLFSGMLEIADSAFDEISNEIDAYKTEINEKSFSQIADAEVDSISLSKFLEELSTKLGITIEGTVGGRIFSEMKQFGVSTIGDLEKLITPEFIATHKNMFHEASTATGVVRRILMFNDIERYLKNKPGFSMLMSTTFNFLAKKYSESEIRQLFKTAQIGIGKKPPRKR